MNIGIIGTGNIARIHALAVNSIVGCHLHSIYGQRIEAASPLAHEFGTRAFSDLQAFLADPALDVVTIATPSGAHLEPTLAALAAGKHVICEKPLEITTARIDVMIEAARVHGKTLAAILNRRFHPAMAELRQACQTGRFGQLTSASCFIKWFRDQAYYDSAAWRGTWALDGGGALMNQGIHTIDALLHLAGPVKWVQAHTTCVAHRDIEVEDLAVAMLEFSNGACGVIEGMTCAWSASGHPARVQLCGTAGSAFLADETLEVWEFLEPQPQDERIRREHMAGASPGIGANSATAIGYGQHQRNFEEILLAIRAGREPATSAAEARKAVAVIETIYRSAKAGGIRLPVE